MKPPKVTKDGAGYCVEISPRAFIRWHTEPRRESLVMVIIIDAPTLTNYARIRECDDLIEFPVGLQ